MAATAAGGVGGSVETGGSIEPGRSLEPEGSALGSGVAGDFVAALAGSALRWLTATDVELTGLGAEVATARSGSYECSGAADRSGSGERSFSNELTAEGLGAAGCRTKYAALTAVTLRPSNPIPSHLGFMRTSPAQYRAIAVPENTVRSRRQPELARSVQNQAP